MKKGIHIELRHTAEKTGIHHTKVSEIARDVRTWIERGVESGAIKIKDKETWKKNWRKSWMADFPDDDYR